MKTPLLSLSILLAFGAGIWMERQVFSPDTPGTARRDSRTFSVLPLGNRAEQAGQAQGESESADGGSEGADRRGKVPLHRLADLLELSREGEMEEALEEHSADQIATLLAELRETNRQDATARQLKRALFRQWAHREPTRALAGVLQESDARLKNAVIHSAFAVMAENGDIEQAKQAFRDLQTHRQREEAVGALSHHVSLEEIGSLAAFLAEESPGTENEALYHRWGELDPGSPLFQSMAIAQGPDALRAAARGWARTDAAEALQWARTVDAEHPGTMAMAGVLETLVDTDPAEAARWLAELSPGRQQRDLLREIAHRWSQEDMDATLQWADTLDSQSRREALQRITHEWANQDPQEAAKFALSLPASEHRSEALAEVAHMWAREDVGQALAWANTLGRDSTRAFHGILETVAEGNPQMAADLVTQLGDTAQVGTYRELAGHVAGQWSENDPAAAAHWAQSLTAEGEVQHHAIERVADHWVDQDPMAASAWIGGLPQGEIRDIATERLVDHVAPTDPDSAYRWALSASSLDHQTEMLHHVFEQWQALDPQAALSTLQAAPITQEQRQDIAEIFRGEQPR